MDDVRKKKFLNKTFFEIQEKKFFQHPGGGDLLLEKAGVDGSKAFKEAAHSKDALELREKYLVGDLIKV